MSWNHSESYNFHISIFFKTHHWKLKMLIKKLRFWVIQQQYGQNKVGKKTETGYQPQYENGENDQNKRTPPL